MSSSLCQSGCAIVMESEVTVELVLRELPGGHPSIISTNGWESEMEPRQAAGPLIEALPRLMPPLLLERDAFCPDK